jgi:hypothetical protein
MRRIIERVVTVVTTTTWKISWEADPPHSEPGADPVPTELRSHEVLAETTRPGPTVLETKEARPTETENSPDLP